MKACFYNQFGPSSGMQIGEIPTPKPIGHQVLVKLMYAGCNPVDWKVREKYLGEAFPHQFPIVPGWDGAGVITACGSEVKDFAVGDAVFGDFRLSVVQYGTYAEYGLANEKFLSKKSDKLDFKIAAALPIISFTAWEELFEHAKLKPGETILIHAGAGGVGSMAIQLASKHGAIVLTTAQKKNHAYVTSLGAKHCIDYTTESLEETVHKLYPEGVDVVIDAVGGDTWRQAFTYIKPRGRIVSIVDRSVNNTAMPAVQTSFLFAEPRRSILQEIERRILSKEMVAPQIEEYPFERAKEALERVQAGQVRGKLVLKIG